MPSNLEETIVLGGTPEHPRVQDCPKLLIAARNQRIVWHIDDRAGTNAEVWVTTFKRKNGGEPEDPLAGPPGNRKAKGHLQKIRETVKADATAVVFEYEVWLNGKMAVDPEIQIKIAP